MSLKALQTTIDRSLDHASTLSRTIFADEAWSASRIQDFVNEVGAMIVATANRSGVPHAAPVVAGCADDDLYFSVSPGSVLRRNLVDGSRIAFTVAGHGHTVVGQGTATPTGEAAELAELIALLAPSSGSGA